MLVASSVLREDELAFRRTACGDPARRRRSRIVPPPAGGAGPTPPLPPSRPQTSPSRPRAGFPCDLSPRDDVRVLLQQGLLLRAAATGRAGAAQPGPSEYGAPPWDVEKPRHRGWTFDRSPREPRPPMSTPGAGSYDHDGGGGPARIPLGTIAKGTATVRMHGGRLAVVSPSIRLRAGPGDYRTPLGLGDNNPALASPLRRSIYATKWEPPGAADGVLAGEVLVRRRPPTSAGPGSYNIPSEFDRVTRNQRLRPRPPAPGPAVVGGRRVAHRGGGVAARAGGECVASFPGRYAEAWDAWAARGAGRGASVACVFQHDGDARWGAHEPADGAGGPCWCHTLYGKRPPGQVGYRSQKDGGAHGSAWEAERAWKRAGHRPAWGCKWFRDWCTNVREARARHQLLVVYFFEGQVGEGKVEWERLKDPGTALWDGVGLGGSQKAEVAFLDRMGWEYKMRDVRELVGPQAAFRPGTAPAPPRPAPPPRPPRSAAAERGASAGAAMTMGRGAGRDASTAWTPIVPGGAA